MFSSIVRNRMTTEKPVEAYSPDGGYSDLGLYPYEIKFQFHGESTSYTEIFWAEDPSDARDAAMAGTTASYVKIVSIKRLEENLRDYA
mgnify:CR=1 FL=1